MILVVQTTPGPLGVPDEIYPVPGLWVLEAIMITRYKNRVTNSTLVLNFKNKIGSHLESSFKIGHDVFATRRNTVTTKGDTLIDTNVF